MEVLKSKPGWKREHKQNGDFLSNILDRIFAISRKDKSFSIKKKITNLDSEISILEEKVKSQRDLLKKANQIEEETSTRIKDINEQNFSMKSRLLEILGSEL